MTIALIVRRSLRQHALSTTITALSIALAGGLLQKTLQRLMQLYAPINGRVGARRIGADVDQVLVPAVGGQRLPRLGGDLLLIGRG